MGKYSKYLGYVFRHKYHVFRECWRLGMFWQGVIHDNSKLRWSELKPYANFFYGPKKNRDNTGYYKPTDTGDKAFDYAWLLHQKRNKHHWQFWILPEDEGGIKILPMPDKYRKEMVADWWGAGRAQGFKPKPFDHYSETRKWYLANRHKMQLHEDTQRWIEVKLGLGLELKSVKSGDWKDPNIWK